jgi:hypothetical protein
MSSAVYLWKTFRAQAEQHSGVSQKVFGFSPESVFAFIPECCSESARNPVRLHPGTLFGLPRNTHRVGLLIFAVVQDCSNRGASSANSANQLITGSFLVRHYT